MRQPLSRPRRVAIGDPQAPFDKFLVILKRHGLLAAGDRLADDVSLVSIGDHFDWGGRGERALAAEDGARLLEWLASHASDQVAIVAGNHDLARVGELVGFDDAGFAAAQAEADSIYVNGRVVDPDEEDAFKRRWPALPTAETAARDLAGFRADQRALVASLLREGRFMLGLAATDDLLLCHAGVTRDDLGRIDVPPERWRDAQAVAGALNAALDTAVAGWNAASPLSIPGLHRPGSARDGECRGILVQRPAHPDSEAHLCVGPPRRRFDPRGLPAGLTQAIGHIRDKKSRDLLGPWADGAASQDGPLRHLRVRGDDVRYTRGLPATQDPDAATLLFLDGGMNFVRDVADYELLDLDTRRPLRP